MDVRAINDIIHQAELYEGTGKLEIAEALYQQALALCSDDPESKRNLYEKIGKIFFEKHITMETRVYQSSWDKIKLTAEFWVPEKPKPLCLFFHGWHMTAEDSRKAGSVYPLAKDFFVINVNMRGRGGSEGAPDASGFELLDGIDAIHYAAAQWKEKIDFSRGPYVVGISGGGGNTLALLGKAPDIFAAAVESAGMSDYALWFKGDRKGCYRDEMTKWIAPSPEEDLSSYKSRSGLFLIENVLTPLLVIHGENDDCVPFIHLQKYEKRATLLKKTNIKFIKNVMGHNSMEWDKALAFLNEYKTPPELSKKGEMIIASFLYCKKFSVRLSSPDCIGVLSYELNENGYPIYLGFTQDNSAMLSEHAEVRLHSLKSVNTLQVLPNFVLDKIDSPGSGGCEFIIKGKGNWVVQLNY